jgi:hypothetical protein
MGLVVDADRGTVRHGVGGPAGLEARRRHRRPRVLAAILVIVAIRAWDALGRIAAAFWTMALTLFTLLAFVIAAGLFSRGFQWVVASMPDKLGVGAL